jgi:hypothetical protein
MLRMSSALAGAMLFSAPAFAGISDDLKFCARLTSGKERLACYDAAARIEKRAAPVKRVAATPMQVPVFIAAHAQVASPGSRFSGAYVGITAGYDIPMTSHGTRESPYNSHNYYPDVPIDSINGTKSGLVAGYNATSGPLMLGFEARAMYNFNETSASATNTYPGQSLPWITSSLWCGGCDKAFLDNYPINAYPYSISSSNTQTVRLSRPWQTNFALRTGIIFQDWMIFGKAGIGVEASRVVNTNDSSASVTCTQPIAERRRPDPSTVQIATVGCAATSPGPITTTIANSINPTAIFGIGVERNFGDYFARAEAEMTAHLVSGTAYYTPEVNITAGYRF